MCQIQSGNGIVVLQITLTELASLGAGSSVPAGLCPFGSASFQAAGTGIFNMGPGKVRLVQLLGPVPGSLFVNPLQNKAGLWPGCATPYQGHCSCGTRCQGCCWEGGGAQGCALIPCVPLTARAGSSLGAAAVPEAVQAGEAWDGCTGGGAVPSPWALLATPGVSGAVPSVDLSPHW